MMKTIEVALGDTIKVATLTKPEPDRYDVYLGKKKIGRIDKCFKTKRFGGGQYFDCWFAWIPGSNESVNATTLRAAVRFLVKNSAEPQEQTQ